MVEFPQSGVYAKRLVAVIEPHFHHGRGFLHSASPLELLSAQNLTESGFSLDDSTKAIAKRIPAYMMPTTWLAVASLPLTDSKKVDRRKVRNWLAGLSLADDPASFYIARAPPIPSDDTLALEIGNRIIKMIANGNDQVSAALEGRSFELATAGIDSIQIMTLSKWIRDEFGLKLSAGRLTRPGLTIIDLARIVAAFRDGKEEPGKLKSCGPNILYEVNVLSSKFGRPRSETLKPAVLDKVISTVLLTGATGFLGIEILHQLLCIQGIKKVFVVVRATDAQHGRERIVTAAKRATWWSASFDDRIEVWLGDISRAKLGLSDQQWDRLTSIAATKASIDAVIHNGAAVQWNQGYESLRNPKTISTAQLLEAMAERRSSGRFVYVSGGQMLTTGVDDESAMASQAAHLIGYAQTKIVSELLVKRFSESERGRGHVARVVKPSYIIGDARRGMANQGDYFWGLAKSFIELGTYSRDVRDGWLFVSDVVRVTRAVCLICSTKKTTPTLVKILDGLVMQDFWNILACDFGYELKAVDGGEWWSSLRSHVERAGPQHCLWALQDILEAERGEIASTATVPTAEMTAKSPSILRAVRSNVRYLTHDVRFLPGAPPRCNGRSSKGTKEK